MSLALSAPTQSPLGIMPRLDPRRLAKVSVRRRIAQTGSTQKVDIAHIDAGIDQCRPRHRRIRICVLDAGLQIGGAEWFTSQMMRLANSEMFEFVVLCYRPQPGGLAERLVSLKIQVVSAVSMYGSGLTYTAWTNESLYPMLDFWAPDVVFLSSQYLYGQLRADRLAPYRVVVRISNYDGDATRGIDFSPVSGLVCCSAEQYSSLHVIHPEQAVFVPTGVDLNHFRPASPAERRQCRRRLGLPAEGPVILFCGRLGDPLKRLGRFQEIVRLVRTRRPDARFLVAGYFENHRRTGAEAFQQFCQEHEIIWHSGLRPWEMPDCYRAADILLSVSAAGEGLSNTVLQALASGTIPVVTPASGMTDLVVDGHNGFLLAVDDPEEVTGVVIRALELGKREASRIRAAGRRRAEKLFDLRDCIDAYERIFYHVYQRSKVRLPITDAFFGIGGAEWLAALLCLNVNPAKLEMMLLLNEDSAPLAQWMKGRGVPVLCPPPGVNYDMWSQSWLPSTFRSRRPHVVMPCTSTSWPMSRGRHRLLGISQNASDGEVLTQDQYDWADHVICVSEDVRKALAQDRQYKMTVLRNSIDVAMFRRNPADRVSVRARLGIPDDRRIVLWVGRLSEPRKRPDVLREVIERALARPDLHFLVLGYFKSGSPQETDWREFVAGHSNLSWVSGLRNWETPEYYSAADLYLSTSGYSDSDFEGLSLAAVQGLAAGLPIVTTRSGGQSEVVTHGINGFLTPTGDADGLFARLSQVSDLPASEIEAMSRRNIAKAEADFDIRTYARRYETIAWTLKNAVDAALPYDPNAETEILEFADSTALTPAGRHAASFFANHLSALLIDRGRERRAKTATLEGFAESVGMLGLANGKPTESERAEWAVLWELARDAAGSVLELGAPASVTTLVMAHAVRESVISTKELPHWICRSNLAVRSKGKAGSERSHSVDGGTIAAVPGDLHPLGVQRRIGDGTSAPERLSLLVLHGGLPEADIRVGLAYAATTLEPGGSVVISRCPRPREGRVDGPAGLGTPAIVLLDHLKEAFPVWRRPFQVEGLVVLVKRAC